MRTVKLYGHLGKQFGKIHQFEVRTPAEAIRALMANHKGFEQALLNKDYAGYKIIVGNEQRESKEELRYPADGDIKIIPVVQGAGGNTGMIIIGVVLIAAATILTMGTGTLAAAAIEAGIEVGTAEAIAAGAMVETIATAAATGMAVAGTALVLSGISGLLFSASAPASRDAEEQYTSKYFNGAVNLTSQGNPVPLVYGRVRVGSQVISAGLLTYKE